MKLSPIGYMALGAVVALTSLQASAYLPDAPLDEATRFVLERWGANIVDVYGLPEDSRLSKNLSAYYAAMGRADGSATGQSPGMVRASLPPYFSYVMRDGGAKFTGDPRAPENQMLAQQAPMVIVPPENQSSAAVAELIVWLAAQAYGFQSYPGGRTERVARACEAAKDREPVAACAVEVNVIAVGDIGDDLTFCTNMRFTSLRPGSRIGDSFSLISKNSCIKVNRVGGYRNETAHWDQLAPRVASLIHGFVSNLAGAQQQHLDQLIERLD